MGVWDDKSAAAAATAPFLSFKLSISLAAVITGEFQMVCRAPTLFG
jgi:hypothetical protein